MDNTTIELDQGLFRSIDFRSEYFKKNARDIVANWARHPPFYIRSESFTEVVCGRYADAYDVFFDPKRFSSELPRGHGFEKFDKFMGIQTLPQTDGAPHARLKRLLSPAFSPSALAYLDVRITAIVNSILDRIEAGGRHFDGMVDYGSHLIVGALLEAMLNLSDDQRSVFLELHEVLPLTTFTRPGEPYPPHCVAAFDRAKAMVNDIIHERRTHPGTDFISELIRARDEGDKLSDEELFNQIFTLCGAALSATSRAMGGALYALYSHPEQLEILRGDSALMPMAVEECLRFASSGYFTFPRIATCDTEIGGVPILKGMVVRPSPQAANLDPMVYEDPLRFDVRRDPKRILSFGFGHHHCLGNRLGRTAIAIALSQLIQRFPNARLADADFLPEYGGAVGELRIMSLPMVTH